MFQLGSVGVIMGILLSLLAIFEDKSLAFLALSFVVGGLVLIVVSAVDSPPNNQLYHRDLAERRAVRHMAAGGAVLEVRVEIENHSVWRARHLFSDTDSALYIGDSHVILWVNGRWHNINLAPSAWSTVQYTYDQPDQDGFVMVGGKSVRPEYHDPRTGLIVYSEFGEHHPIFDQ